MAWKQIKRLRLRPRFKVLGLTCSSKLIGALTLSILLKLLPRKSKPWFILWSFYKYYFGRCSSELAQLVALPYSWRRSTRYSDRLLCMIFLSPFLDVTRISTATVSFLAQLEYGFSAYRMLAFDLWSKLL